ncbi:hypothetical protein K8Z61_05010 [Nocardioides sp. TRM66260-LWL]|uniref:hypothetical protein n=1 Tax=Nocardioides sp. TRM66260-LWL TaxID=2874478 RepID=UPI001CC420D5|nr:hypothetical protein [Nocardioides sp. TRM66260-LWL]MBZ5733847.1 hypothetical protein [Nocardioides sp. TRM66260-LWL]
MSAVRVSGLSLRSPVLVAAGCGGRELHAWSPLDALGAVVTRTVTLDARPGARWPRVVESPAGLLHATGRPNPGLEGFLAGELPELVRLGARVVVSVAGVAALPGQSDGLVPLARRLGALPGVAALELDLATPEAAHQGLLSAEEPHAVALAVGAVVRELPPGVPLWAKLPGRPGVVAAARAAAEAGAGAVVVGGAVPAALPDGRPCGLSGPAIGGVTRRWVREVCDALPALDVVASGGVAGVDDVRALRALGAVAVQVGSVALHDPAAPGRIAAELAVRPSPSPDSRGGAA